MGNLGVNGSDDADYLDLTGGKAAAEAGSQEPAPEAVAAEAAQEPRAVAVAVAAEPAEEPCTNIHGDNGIGHFIPFRKADVIRMCVADGALPTAEHQGFRDFSRILSALFHFEYHKKLETLKDSFAPFNPDADTRAVDDIDESERLRREKAFIEMLREVLAGANYVELSRDELEESLDTESRFKIKLSVDLDDFEKLLVFVRGKGPKEEKKRVLGIFHKKIETPHYERVAIYGRFKDKKYFKKKGIRNPPFDPDSSYLKLFKDIPVADIEVIFPNARVSMRKVDKIMVGVPAAAGGLVVLVTKLGTTLLLVLGLIALWVGLKDAAVSLGLESTDVTLKQEHLVALGIGLVTLGGYVFRQLGKLKSRKLKYLKKLSENLYFKVLDNNAGVFSHVIDAAEEEDNKEAILAYYFLLTRRRRNLTEKQLDAFIEQWFLDKHDTVLDFEVDDAMAKLERLELAWREGDVLRVKPLDEAKVRIDTIWDNYFLYNNNAQGTASA